MLEIKDSFGKTIRLRSDNQFLEVDTSDHYSELRLDKMQAAALGAALVKWSQ